MSSYSPSNARLSAKQDGAALQLSSRLKKCWTLSLDLSLFPDKLAKYIHQDEKATSMPTDAVLCGLLLIVSYSMAHSVVQVEGIDWMEPVLVWASICMPTGSGKSTLCKLLRKLVHETRSECGQSEGPFWLSDDQSFEKLRELMNDNSGKLLGLYDELSMFLAQMNVCRGRNVTDSQQVSTFLQLYGSDQWIRRTVSGEANFTMFRTGFTVGGFTQLAVARGLIENPSNIEKGLCQRFLWLVPSPNPVPFMELEPVDKDFCASIVNLMSTMCKSTSSLRVWVLKRPCDLFQQKYDEVERNKSQIGCMDDFLCGMLSKSKGQILRIAATLHVLFNWENPKDIPQEISSDALKAAINFVDVCIQHSAYLGGRGDISEAINNLQKIQQSFTVTSTQDSQAHDNAAFSLLLPGRILYLSALLVQTKFRGRGNKAGALSGWNLLQEAGVAKLVERKHGRGTDKVYELHKSPIPDESDEKAKFCEGLLRFNVSLPQYRQSLEMDDVTMETILNKRKSSQLSIRTSPRSIKPRLQDQENQLTHNAKRTLFNGDENESK